MRYKKTYSRLGAILGVVVSVSLAALFLSLSAALVMVSIRDGQAVTPIWIVVAAACAGLLLLVYAAGEALAPAPYVAFEADAQARMLRIDKLRIDSTVNTIFSKAVPFDDIVEIRLVPVSGKSSRYFELGIVLPNGKGHALASFDRVDEGRDIAARLAAEIGCPLCDTPFPLERPSVSILGVFLGVCLIFQFFGMVVALGILPALMLIQVWGRGLPNGQVLLMLLVPPVLFVAPFVIVFRRAWKSRPDMPVDVRADPAGRVLQVRRRRGLLGWDTWTYPYDDIAEIVAEIAEAAETTQAGEPGGTGAPVGAGLAAERPASYRVRIVPQEGALRDDVPWHGAGVPGPARDDTVFRMNDRDEARLTAERLARRIGRPWRDATA